MTARSEAIAPTAPDGSSGSDAQKLNETRATEVSFVGSLFKPNYAVPILLVLGTALYLVNLGGYPLYTKGEPREAVTIVNILQGGGFILPERAGVEIPSKPLLMHWLGAIASRELGGVTEFTVRLPSALFAIAGLLICYFYVRRLFDDDETGFMSALILGTTFQYLQAGTGSRVDTTLTFFLEIAFFEFILMAEGLTSRRLLLYAAASLAVLAKGPVGLVLPGLAALGWIAIDRKWAMLRRMALIRGGIVVAIIAGGWYAAATWVGGMDFIHKQIISENLVRFFGGPEFREGHAHRFYYVELVLLSGFMPWTLILAPIGLQAARRPRHLDARMLYLLVWFVVVLLFYSIALSKRGAYLLALYPALAAIVAVYLTDISNAPEAVRGWITVMTRALGAFLIALGTGALAALALLAARPRVLAAVLSLFDVTAPSFLPNLGIAISQHAVFSMVAPIALEAIGIYLLGTAPRTRQMVFGIAGAMACVTLAANLVVVPAIANTLTLKYFAAKAMEMADNERIGYLGALNYDVAFYSRRVIPIVSIHDRDLPTYLICDRAVYEDLSPLEKPRFSVVLLSNPAALDGGDALVLLKLKRKPAPDTTGEQVTMRSE